MADDYSVLSSFHDVVVEAPVNHEVVLSDRSQFHSRQETTEEITGRIIVGVQRTTRLPLTVIPAICLRPDSDRFLPRICR
jgi:hypothetical protein